MYNFLKKLNVLYVDNEKNSQEHIYKLLIPHLKNLYLASNEISAFDIFKELENSENKLDALICDTNNLSLDSIVTLLREIRNDNSEIPFILNINELEKRHLLEIIKLNVTGCFSKPLNIEKILGKLNICCHIYHQNKTIKKQKKELEKYLSAIDNVAIVSKTDLKGKITFANDIFMKISKYSKRELLGKPQNIVRHPDTPKEVFANLWTTIKKGEVWQGTLKNLAKDNSEYYVNTTIFPIFDDLGEEISEYISIRFLTTNDELQKRGFRKKVISNIQESKKKEFDLSNKIKLLESKLLDYQKEINNSAKSISKLDESEKINKKLKNQILHFENEIKEIRNNSHNTVKIATEKIKKLTSEKNTLSVKYQSSEKTLKKYFEEINIKKEKIIDLELRLTEKIKQIENLFEIIEDKEKTITKLSNQTIY